MAEDPRGGFIFRTSRVEEAPTSLTWTTGTPVAEVSESDGNNYEGYDDE